MKSMQKYLIFIVPAIALALGLAVGWGIGNMQVKKSRKSVRSGSRKPAAKPLICKESWKTINRRRQRLWKLNARRTSINWMVKKSPGVSDGQVKG